MRFRHYRGVRYVAPWKPAPIEFARCGACGRAWDDAKSTELTPAPSGRCPFEYWHKSAMNPLTLDALRKTIHKATSGNRGQPERKSMKVYIVQRETLVGNEVDCFTNPDMAQEWAHLVRSHVQIEETMDERLPEFIETYKRLPVIEGDS